jgi:hypothetical protein
MSARKEKKYIFFAFCCSIFAGTLLLKYITYHILLVPVLAPNYKQHISPPDKSEKYVTD